MYFVLLEYTETVVDKALYTARIHIIDARAVLPDVKKEKTAIAARRNEFYLPWRMNEYAERDVAVGLKFYRSACLKHSTGDGYSKPRPFYTFLTFHFAWVSPEITDMRSASLGQMGKPYLSRV